MLFPKGFLAPSFSWQPPWLHLSLACAQSGNSHCPRQGFSPVFPLVCRGRLVMGPGLSPPPCLGLAMLLLLSFPSLSYNAFLGSPACHLAVMTSSRGSLEDLSFVPLSHNPSLTLLSNSHLPVTICSMTRRPEPLGSERAGPSWLVHCARPKAPRQHFMAVQWAPGIPHPELGSWLIPGPHPQPFTHQGKGTQQAIPTRSPAAQYSNSWGRWEGPGIQRKEWSGQRKNRRDCEKELWMKCEKQKHEGEENSSKPKRGNRRFQPTHIWLVGDRSRRSCSPGSENPAGEAAHGQGSSAHLQQGQPSGGPKLLVMPSFIQSFIHSFHSPTLCSAQSSCPINCVECTNEYSTQVTT